MSDNFQKALNLSRKTGTRLIVFDSSASGGASVIMPMEEYEKLVDREPVRDLTEGELIDKINRDIALWKSEQEGHLEAPSGLFKIGESKPDLDRKTADGSFRPSPKKRWGIPESRKSAAAEVVEESAMEPEISI